MTGQDDQPTLDQGATPSSPTPRPTSPAGVPARYEVLRELGSGGMGIVYQARDKETGETVALKVLQPEIAADATALERFKNELRLARKITHKNVCRIYEFHSATGGACISMEYVEGQSLRALLSHVEGLSVKQGSKIVRQVLAGVAEAHAQSVVHRDLKPENVMITPDGTAKVMDFGIAVAGTTRTTLQGPVAGTPAYMSPEQAEGKTADARSDIYALGLVMFELFTGRAAMAGETPLAVVHKQINYIPHPPREYEPDLPERIDRAIQRCLEKDPKRRFQKVAELEEALEKNAPAPVELEEADPEAPPHLSLWGHVDTAFAILGVISFIYFLSVRDRVFPASSMKIEVDVITARRTMEDVVRRLPIGFKPINRAEIEFRGWLRHDPTDRVASLRRSSEWPATWDAEPLVWTFRALNNSAVVDSKGKLQSLVGLGRDSTVLRAGYRPPSAEERQRLATQMAETACGSVRPAFQLRETIGGEAGSSYKAEWFGSTERFVIPQVQMRVELKEERVVAVQCNAPVERGERELTFDNAVISLRWVFGATLTVALGILFVVGRSYRLPTARARLWLAGPLGVILAGIAYGTVTDATAWDLNHMGQAPPSVVAVFAAIGFSAIAWMALTTAEHRLRRECPQWIATYLLLWRGRMTRAAVLLALVRGCLAGLMLIAFETALAHSTLVRGRDDPGLGAWIFFVDHEPIAQAATSSWPALFTVAAAFFSAILIGLIFLGTITAAFARDLRASVWRRWYAGGFGIPFLWWATTLHLYLAGFLPMVRSSSMAFFIEALFLGWLLRRFDVLTVMSAVFTAVLWIMNYPLLDIFHELGNSGHLAVLGGWHLLIVTAAAMAFRRPLTDYWRQARAQME